MDHGVSIERRLEAMRQFHEAGIETTCFISPIFPGITDVPAIIDRVKGQCNLVWLENLNLRGDYKDASWTGFMRIIPNWMNSTGKYTARTTGHIGVSWMRRSGNTPRLTVSVMSETMIPSAPGMVNCR